MNVLIDSRLKTQPESEDVEHTLYNRYLSEQT
jgi:hypothetical protein